MPCDEKRLTHYGYVIRPSGKFWTFSPNGRGALLASREIAVTRALGALELSLAEARRLVALQAAERVPA